MRRLALALAVLLAASPLGAQNVRVEIGQGGVYVAGEWTNCRITGIDNVPDGTRVTVTVSDMFIRELRVERGVAECLIIIPDDSPTIRLDVTGKGSVRLPPEDLARLKCVKDERHPGSVRPDLYAIFGAPAWSMGARRTVALGFCGLLMLVALGGVIPWKWAWRMDWVAIAVVSLMVLFLMPVWLSKEHQSESVSVFEADGPNRPGQRITVMSKAFLAKEDLDRESVIAEGSVFVPVASRRGEWEEHPVRVDEESRVWRTCDRIPSRGVVWSERPGATPYPAPAMAPVDARTRELREATERWWRAGHGKDASSYALAWTADPPEKGVFSAGTLIAVRQADAP